LADESSTTKLVSLASNLVDRIHEPDPRPDSPLYDYPLSIAGQTTADKLAILRSTLSSKTREGQDWIYLIPSLTSIAWLFNFRCEGDVEGTPIAYAYAAITRDQCVLFVEDKKVQDESLRKRWEDEGIEIKPYGVREIEKFVREAKSDMASEKSRDVKLWAPKECSWALQEACKVSPIPRNPVIPLISVRNRNHPLSYRRCESSQESIRAPSYAKRLSSRWTSYCMSRL
jgi:Xaa-Pro aminopeptidase